MRRTITLFAGAVLVIVCAATASAGTIFSNRAAWNAQVSGITTEDFNALAGKFYQTLTLGSVTFDVPGDADPNALWVSTTGSYTPIGNALVGNHSMTTVRAMFSPATTAVGADVANLAVNDNIKIEVQINGTWSQWSVPYTYPTSFFWGIVAGPGESIDGIKFSPTTTNWVGIDNFSYGAAAESTVPEPAMSLLVGAGIGLIGLAAYRRKR